MSAFMLVGAGACDDYAILDEFPSGTVRRCTTADNVFVFNFCVPAEDEQTARRMVVGHTIQRGGTVTEYYLSVKAMGEEDGKYLFFLPKASEAVRMALTEFTQGDTHDEEDPS